MTTTMSVRIDNDAKKGLTEVCKELGITASAAFNMFARKVMRERKIPFDLSLEDNIIYNNGNVMAIKKAMSNIKKGKYITHDIIEKKSGSHYKN